MSKRIQKLIGSALATAAVVASTAGSELPPAPLPASGSGDLVTQLALPYQQTIANDRSRIVVVEKARRIGGTEAIAMREAVLGLFEERPTNVWFSSADESAAREFVIRVVHWVKILGTVIEMMTGTEVIDAREYKVFEVTFPSGARLTAMASNPKGFRSKGGRVILDEFAHHDQAEEMWKAAYPVITWGGSITVLSTHNGEQSKFNGICAMGRRRRGDAMAGPVKPDDYPVSLHTYTIHDAVAMGLVERINQVSGRSQTREEFVAELRAGMTLEDWEEEYECKPGSQAGSLLPYTLTRPCVHISCPMPTDNLSVFIADVLRVAQECEALFGGIDIGRTHDLFVFWMLARRGGAMWTAGMLVWQGRTFSEMAGAGDAMLADRRLRRMCVDSTGLGMQLGEQWRQKHGSHRVEDIQITTPVKEEIYPLTRRHVEERTLMLHASDVTLADLASVRCEVTAAGKVRYVGERTKHGHADRACALALALHAAETGQSVARAVRVVGVYG